MIFLISAVGVGSPLLQQRSDIAAESAIDLLGQKSLVAGMAVDSRVTGARLPEALALNGVNDPGGLLDREIINQAVQSG